MAVAAATVVGVPDSVRVAASKVRPGTAGVRV